jgi:M3 family oligoendopeptidase
MSTKFSEIHYVRPDAAAVRDQMNQLIGELKQAGMAARQIELIEEIYRLRSRFETLSNVAGIRHSIDTSDKFYEEEQHYFDANYPVYQQAVTSFYHALLDSPFRPQLEDRFGKQLFHLADVQVKTFRPEIMEDLRRENELSTEYTDLVASAEIAFQGNQYNIAGMMPFKLSPDRATRKEAHESTDAFFVQRENTFDRIYDEMVKVRQRIAVKLGYENFIPVGYLRMCRTDYDASMVQQFREQVKQKIVPLATALRRRQQERLRLDALYYYDEPLDFTSGNAQPKGSPEWIIAHAEKMYSELSPETGEFFRYMQENELMDLVNKPHKAGGGYCTFLSETRSPFIFSNFNGTSHDIDVLTHEAGHAFQTWCSRQLGIDEYYFPTSEAAEIHSMSMEFLTWPWMKLFFNGETEKYQFAHMSHAIQFLPYGVAVDEFQHAVYENFSATPQERKGFWRQIEKKYLPHRNYAGSDYLTGGGFWHRQAHIFKHPFYYIDYTLAQICAFQFWQRSRENRETAMSDYIRLCKEGGSKSFLELVRVARLDSPFEAATFDQAVGAVKEWLSAVDDIRLN